MNNILIRLRQACCHPYLLPGQEPEVGCRLSAGQGRWRHCRLGAGAVLYAATPSRAARSTLASARCAWHPAAPVVPPHTYLTRCPVAPICCTLPWQEYKEPEHSEVAEEGWRLMVAASGKLTVLQQMLPRLLADGHRVLIFSQSVEASNSVWSVSSCSL